MTGSIRARLTAYLLICIGLLILVGDIRLERSVARWLRRGLDQGLQAKAWALVTLTRQHDGRVELDFADEFMPEFESRSDPSYFELWIDGDHLLERSRSFWSTPEWEEARLARDPTLTAEARFRNVVLPDGRPGRLVQIDFVPQSIHEAGEVFREPLHQREELHRDPTEIAPGSGLHTASVLVAEDRAALDAEILRLRGSLAFFTAILLAAIAALIALAVRVGLRPVENLVGQMRGLDAESLDRRVALSSPARELEPVVEQLNRLLTRLEAAFRRERRLTSDIAHELKTPISELRSLCEVGTQWPDDAELAREFFADATAISLEMERLVVHLLALARYDEGKEVVQTGSAHPAALVDQAWSHLAAQADSRGIALRNRIAPGAAIATDPDKLALILSNLLSNAVAYSRPNTPVTCTFERAAAVDRLVISNEPEHLDAADLPLMFERFWRKDEARTGGHNVGLGLAIVRAFADLLGFEVETDLAPTGLLSITLARRR